MWLGGHCKGAGVQTPVWLGVAPWRGGMEIDTCVVRGTL